MTQRLEADVLVIGSGAGGAPTAALAAEAGRDVVVLEEGPLVRQGEVVPFSLEQMGRQYRAGGVTPALGLPSITYTEGCCAGGGTEVNSGLYRRPPEDVLARWGLAGEAAAEVYAICDEVEKELTVQTVPGGAAAGQRGVASRRCGPRLAARREPAVDGVPGRSGGVAGPPAEHDRDLPATGRSRRAPGCSPDTGSTG